MVAMTAYQVRGGTPILKAAVPHRNLGAYGGTVYYDEQDSDGETPLHVCEHVETAQVRLLWVGVTL